MSQRQSRGAPTLPERTELRRLRLKRARSRAVGAPCGVMVAGSMAAGKTAMVRALMRGAPVIKPIVTVVRETQ